MIKVTGAQTNEPLPVVAVMLKTSNKAAFTDRNGAYTITVDPRPHPHLIIKH